MRFVYPPTIVDGDVLSRVQIDAFRLNDEYFNGCANSWAAIPAGVIRGYIGDERDLEIYDGWHMLREDAKTLHYHIFADGGDWQRVTVDLHYAGQSVVSVTSPSGGGRGEKSGTIDLSAKPPGLYRVQAIMSRNEIPGGAGGIFPPFTSYTGPLSYTTPPTITDGQVSSANHFNAWRDNDHYFRAQVPANIPFTGFRGGFGGSHWVRLLWFGMIRWHPDRSRIHYKVSLGTNKGGNQIRMQFDNMTHTIKAEGVTEGYWDVVAPQKGGFYPLYVYLERDDDTVDGGAEIFYIYTSNPGVPTGYTNMDRFTAGQYVYGNTVGQNTSLQLLSDNDAAIYDRLVYSDGATGRMDYAVMTPRFARLGGIDKGKLACSRRYDVLYYRTKKAVLKWEDDNSTALKDYEDDEPWWALNLNSLGVSVGQVYTIEGEEVCFAWEV